MIRHHGNSLYRRLRQCKAVVGRGTFGVVRLVTPKDKKARGQDSPLNPAIARRMFSRQKSADGNLLKWMQPKPGHAVMQVFLRRLKKLYHYTKYCLGGVL